jgi:hypothetical protein
MSSELTSTCRHRCRRDESSSTCSCTRGLFGRPTASRSQAVGRFQATSTIRCPAANSVPTRHDIRQVSFLARVLWIRSRAAVSQYQCRPLKDPLASALAPSPRHPRECWHRALSCLGILPCDSIQCHATSTTPRNASDTANAHGGRWPFSQKRDLVRDKGGTPSGVNPKYSRLKNELKSWCFCGTSLYLGRATSASDMPRARSFRMITDAHVPAVKLTSCQSSGVMRPLFRGPGGPGSTRSPSPGSPRTSRR